MPHNTDRNIGRLIAVGDIHGRLAMLQKLLTDIDPLVTDQFVFLGDYIDRGPDSPGVLDLLIDFQQRFPQTVFIRGNHEQMLLDACIAAERRQAGRMDLFDDYLALSSRGLPGPVHMFVVNGGSATLAAYASAGPADDPCARLLNIPEFHLEFIRQTQFYYLREPFVFVHAGLNPKDFAAGRKDKEAFLWERRPLWEKEKDWNRVVVHGHTPVSGAFFTATEINLDTGAGYDRTLSACDVLTRRLWTCSASEV